MGQDLAQGHAVVARAEGEVVVLDLKLPGMDGLELLDRLVASHPETAVIMITAAAPSEIDDDVAAVTVPSFAGTFRRFW